MMLPQIQSSLERYLIELPNKIKLRDNDSDGFILRNKLMNLQYYGENVGCRELCCYFSKFVMPQNLELNLSATYTPKNRNAIVWAMVLKDKKDNTIDHEQSEHCSMEEFMQRPHLMPLASDFLNKVLDKYNFHDIYEEFEKLRLEEKRKKQQSLAKRTLDAIITGDF